MTTLMQKLRNYAVSGTFGLSDGITTPFTISSALNPELSPFLENPSRYLEGDDTERQSGKYRMNYFLNIPLGTMLGTLPVGFAILKMARLGDLGDVDLATASAVLSLYIASNFGDFLGKRKRRNQTPRESTYEGSESFIGKLDLVKTTKNLPVDKPLDKKEKSNEEYIPLPDIRNSKNPNTQYGEPKNIEELDSDKK